MREKRNGYKSLFEKFEENRSPVLCRHRCDDNIKKKYILTKLLFSSGKSSVLHRGGRAPSKV
jgi:hypothetical protein